MDPLCSGNNSDAKAASQQIQRLMITSYHVSFTALILCFHHFGRDTLYLGPCAFFLTLLHHGLVLSDRRKPGATASVFPVPAIPTSVSPRPLGKVPLSSSLPMIFVDWLAGIIWLIASAVVSSALGVSFWAHPRRRLEHTFLLAEVMLTLAEAVLLMIIAASCLRERHLVRHSAEDSEALHDLDEKNAWTFNNIRTSNV